MRYIFFTLFIVALLSFYGFRSTKTIKIAIDKEVATTASPEVKPVEKIEVKPIGETMQKNVETTQQASGFVEYAKTLIGTPYLYGSVNPDKGLDCSGFVNCVSDHFGIEVPRSSADFTDFGKTIETDDAKPGDLILFTGTDPGRHVVGHIGIITDNLNGNIQFIHSSSGKANGVTISELSGYYETRFVKVIRIFPQDKMAG